MAPLNDAIQVEEYDYDFSADGGVQGEIILSNKERENPIPVGAIVLAVTMKVVTAFTSGGSATLAWGNGDDPDGYSGAAIAVASLTDNVLFNGWDNGAALLWDDTNDHVIYVNSLAEASGRLSVTIGTADMTAGKAAFMVHYLAPVLS